MTLVVVIAIVASLTLTPLAKKAAWRFGAVSHPDGHRRLHSRPTALWGGSAVYVAVTLGVMASYRTVPGTLNTAMMLGALGLSGGMLCLLGCYDDYYEIRARWKLLGQLIATLPVALVACNFHQIIFFGQGMAPVGYNIDFGWLGFLGTIGWLVLGINAMNLLDGMDGLASLVGILISVAVACISSVHGSPEVVLLALVLAGALTGFLVFNLPPAKIYLGDCGSMVVGLAVSVLVLQVATASPTTVNLTVALALLFLPLLDTALAVVRRTLTGHGLMVGDRGHIHHRLLDRGFSVWSVLLILGSISVVSGFAAWITAAWQLEILTWTTLAVLMAVSVNRRILGHVEWELVKRSALRTAAQITRRFLPAQRPGQTRTEPISPMSILRGGSDPDAKSQQLSSTDDPNAPDRGKRAA